jgi:hypothetical protein
VKDRDLLADLVRILSRIGGHLWPDEIEQLSAARIALASPPSGPDQHRHSVQVSCDRCHAVLCMSSSILADLDAHLHRTAPALGWLLSSATSQGLGMGPSDVPRDLCKACVDLGLLR